MSDLCNEIEKFGKAVGNASRYRLVEALFRGPKTVSELVKLTKLSQPLVSQHLKVLKASGLVSDERHGQEVVYTVDAAYTIKLLQRLTSEIKKTTA